MEEDIEINKQDYLFHSPFFWSKISESDLINVIDEDRIVMICIEASFNNCLSKKFESNQEQ